MTDPASPIIDFYPPDFELDLNGKKQDWEAVVLIPFIDQQRLLDTMKSRSSPIATNYQPNNIFCQQRRKDVIHGVMVYDSPTTKI